MTITQLAAANAARWAIIARADRLTAIKNAPYAGLPVHGPSPRYDALESLQASEDGMTVSMARED